MKDLHYVITVQWNEPSGLHVATENGVLPANGRTRGQLYLDIYGEATKRFGAPSARTSVLFFSLEPNEIR